MLQVSAAAAAAMQPEVTRAAAGSWVKAESQRDAQGSSGSWSAEAMDSSALVRPVPPSNPSWQAAAALPKGAGRQPARPAEPRRQAVCLQSCTGDGHGLLVRQTATSTSHFNQEFGGGGSLDVSGIATGRPARLLASIPGGFSSPGRLKPWAAWSDLTADPSLSQQLDRRPPRASSPRNCPVIPQHRITNQAVPPPCPSGASPPCGATPAGGMDRAGWKIHLSPKVSEGPKPLRSAQGWGQTCPRRYRAEVGDADSGTQDQGLGLPAAPTQISTNYYYFSTTNASTAIS